MKKGMLFSLLIILSVILSGCLYPQDKLAENQVPYEDQVKSVQSAVDRFQKDNGGILPIKTRDASTPIYQKYPIDFQKLVPKYMAEPPGNSFENGGIFQYVLVDVETKPTVKIFDLRIAETIRDVMIRIRANGYPPYKEKLADNVYSIDFKKLGFKEEPVVKSPYSNQNLPLVITGNAEVFVDYRSDLYKALQTAKHSYKPGDDIRELLVKNSVFVPAYSLPYTIDPKTKDPIFLVK
ncbi:hypothetical protein [Bacillus methanolicus]|uniref:ABC transporter periplasmic binding protein yphF n=1 Tax=Bacillus methanolicus (strain MGA3 / ATCC 53907) TaxID=796606 RepID=I3E9Y9_BACMM|nr:hypothetical protein [Bacillus methanolicus]AIE60555.1 putative protein YphF [Bacillus methanolicus MGA3]EIJ83310.1 hypothetical protein MGA3_08820 [Bacillus methanolicus MGA3]